MLTLGLPLLQTCCPHLVLMVRGTLKVLLEENGHRTFLLRLVVAAAVVRLPAEL